MRSRTSRWIYVGLGWLSFAVGVIGVVVPGLPTTPFMLLALGAFSRGSPRLEAWLLNHRRFGPSLTAWRAHGVVPRRAKWMAWSMMSVSFIYIVGFSHTPTWMKPLIVAAMAYGAWNVGRRPSTVPAMAGAPAVAPVAIAPAVIARASARRRATTTVPIPCPV